ncbi:MAG: Stp1/IreP family PP2C-type Ser/Thr phosphatase [Solirubrobacteraceae bacterium]
MLRAVETTARTDTGRQRRGNEDASYAQPPLFVVADGMGGARAGEVASRIAVEMFEQGLPAEGTPERRLSTVVQNANREIYELSRTEREREGMGTTLTAAYLDQDHVAIAHVGDSRAYMFRAGELVRLTQDHSLVDELVKAGKLTEEQALEHPQRSIITRALGPEPEVTVDTWSYPARPGDVLLLCSDGLTGMISEAHISAILAAAPSLQGAADALIDEANEAGGRDNITVVLSRFEEAQGAYDAEQPTVVGISGTLHGEAHAAAAGAGAGAQLDEPPVNRPPAPPAPRSPGRRARLARTQGLVQRRPAQRELGRLGKTVSALVATCIVLFLFGGGGYLASRQLYFLGTNAQGMVVVYRGFPYVLPFGIRMYETFYVSGVPASLIPPDRRGTLLNHDLRSQAKATELINDLELNQVSG